MHTTAMLAGSRALVLKEFQINYDGPLYVHIVARRSGLTAFLLTLLGIDITTTFDVHADRIEFLQGSLSGRIQTLLPMSSLSVATTGYTKPILLLLGAFLDLIIGIVLLCNDLGGVKAFGGLLLIGCLICIIKFFLNKSLLISVVSNSGWGANICFKRSVIEGVKVDQAQAQEVIRIITRLLMAQTAR